MRIEYIIVGLILALVVLVFLMSMLTGVVPNIETVLNILKK